MFRKLLEYKIGYVPVVDILGINTSDSINQVCTYLVTDVYYAVQP